MLSAKREAGLWTRALSWASWASGVAQGLGNRPGRSGVGRKGQGGQEPSP